MSIRFYGITSWFRNITVGAGTKGWKLGKNSFSTLESLKYWKTVLRGGADGGRGSTDSRWDNHAERRLAAVAEPAGVTTESGRVTQDRWWRLGWPGEVVVVGVGVWQMRMFLMHVRLHDSTIRIVLRGGGVGVADGWPDLGDVVAITWNSINIIIQSHNLKQIQKCFVKIEWEVV